MSRTKPSLSSCCNDLETFGCARPANSEASAIVLGRRSIKISINSNPSRDSAAVSEAAGGREGSRSPRTTARNSFSRSSRVNRVIIRLHIQILHHDLKCHALRLTSSSYLLKKISKEGVAIDIGI